MKKSQWMVPFLACTLAAGMWMTTAQAQDQPQTGDRNARQQRGGERGGQRMSREDMQKRMAERMKTMLEATDEEWTVLEPQIQKVQTMQRDARGGGMMGRRGGQGGSEAQAQQAPVSPVAKASQDLRTALENKDVSADVIKTKLAALRSARVKAQEDLSKAQEELRGLLSARQEAQLVMLGMLD